METRVQRAEEMCPRSHSSLEEGWDGSSGSLSGTHTPTFSIIMLSVQSTLLRLPPVRGWTQTVLRRTQTGPRLPGAQEEGRSGAGLSLPSKGQQMETGAGAREFLSRLGWG